MLQLKCSLTSTAQAFLHRKLLLKTWEFGLIPCFLCDFCWFEWLFFPLNIFFLILSGLFKGLPNSLKELLGSAPPQDDLHANKAAFPRESWQDQVLDVSTRCSSGGRAQWFLSDGPPGKTSPNNQTQLLAGRKGSPSQHPSKQSIIPPLGSCFLSHKLHSQTLGENISQPPFLPPPAPAAQAAESSPGQQRFGFPGGCVVSVLHWAAREPGWDCMAGLLLYLRKGGRTG